MLYAPWHQPPIRVSRRVLGTAALRPAPGPADGVHQPFEPEISWRPWSVPVAEADIPRLHEVLAAIGPSQLADMQARLHCAGQHM